MTQYREGQYEDLTVICCGKTIFRMIYFCGSKSYLDSPKSRNVVKKNKKSQNFGNYSNTAVIANYEWLSPADFKASQHMR